MPPMGHGRRSTERAKDFKGTIRRLLGYVGQHKLAVLLALVFAVGSVVFNIVGPRVLGSVTTKLYEGLVATVQGTGSVDFGWIGTTLLVLLGIYLASSVCNCVTCEAVYSVVRPSSNAESVSRFNSSALAPTIVPRSALACSKSRIF